MCIVSKGIVELHGGSISVTSEGIGKGTCFSIVLPVASKDDDASHDALEDMNTQATLPHLSLQSRRWLSRKCMFAWIYDSYSSFQERCSRFESSHENPVGVPFSNNTKMNGATNFSANEIRNSEHCVLNYVNNDTEEMSSKNNNLNNKNSKVMNSEHAGQHDDPVENVCRNRSIKRDDKIMPLLLSSLEFRRVLIVDDVAMNRKMLKRLFETRFEQCHEAEDGQQAVDMVKEALASGVNYDIITMDYQMPVMDGVTATKLIRKLGYKGQIIGVTGNALQGDIKAFISNGASIVLAKPLSITTLDDYLTTVVKH